MIPAGRKRYRPPDTAIPSPAGRKTIAELMHTRDDVRTLQRLTAANPEARRGLGHSTATQMGIPLSQEAEDKEPDMYFPL